MKALPFAALLVVVAVTSTASAQRYGSVYGAPYRASTVGESRARGFADVVRSRGDAAVKHGVAARQFEEARSRNLDNRLKYAETYFERKRINKEYREANTKRPTEEQLFRLAKQAAPKRLSPSELDPISGDVKWPVLLQRPEFAASRDALGGMLDEWAAGHGESSEVYNALMEEATGMRTILTSNARQLAGPQYIEARRFLDGLIYEIKLALQ